MTYADFISRFDKQTKTTKGVMVRCPSHEDSTASLAVGQSNNGSILLKCFAGCKSEQVVASLGLTMKDLYPSEPPKHFAPPPAKNGHAAEASVIEKIYSYRDEVGNERYQALRMKPKSFRQRRMVGGKWVWNMDDVERILYRLPEILKAECVVVCEGEKDVDNLVQLGFEATCNVGGAGKWLDGYTASLEGKDVVLCGDNDEPGRKHIEMVFESIRGSAKTVKIVKLPNEVKDVSDYMQTFSKPDEAKIAISSLILDAHPFVKGHKLPIYTVSELEEGYQSFINSYEQNSFSLGKWLPSLGLNIRPLVCGELVFILGNTGAGKTAILSEIARSAMPLPTVLFELELPPELLYERILAAGFKMKCTEVEMAYKGGDRLGKALDSKFKNLFICTESRVTLQDLENYIIRSALKIGERPKLILIDYIQLVGIEGINRREKTSDVAEGLKVIAKQTRTIIIVSSQVKRPDDDDPEIGLHDGKESGSIESSCGLLLGCWRDPKDSSLLYVKVLKSTKGGAGVLVPCNFDGSKMTITERSRFDEPDYQSPHANE